MLERHMQFSSRTIAIRERIDEKASQVLLLIFSPPLSSGFATVFEYLRKRLQVTEKAKTLE